MFEVLSVFEQSIYVEVVLNRLESMGIKREQIFAADLRQPPQTQKSDSASIDYDGRSLTDLGFIFATIMGVIGASIGFRLPFGPIVWGVSMSIIGFLAGLLINWLLGKRNKKKEFSPKVVIIIRCESNQLQEVERVLWTHRALGLLVNEY